MTKVRVVQVLEIGVETDVKVISTTVEPVCEEAPAVVKLAETAAPAEVVAPPAAEGAAPCEEAGAKAPCAEKPVVEAAD